MIKKIKLLVVDDEQMVRTFIKTVVEKENLPVSEVLEADNGSDAILMARQHNPELILLDIHMPGCNGLWAAEKIIEENNNAHIVIISAYNDFEYARTALRAGVIDYLLKPVRADEFVNLILGVAEKKSHSEGGNHSQKAPLVVAVDEFLEKNAEMAIQLKDIASAMFVSPFHLSRRFKQITGKSISDYVQKFRLDKAEVLLQDTDLTIMEISGKVGFNDAAYFTTCFKNHKGITPLKFRKKHNFCEEEN